MAMHVITSYSIHYTKLYEHLFVVSTQVPGVPEDLPYGVALVLISIVLLLNSLSIVFRMHLRGKKKW